MLVCGIDIGTTNLKVALFDGENRLVWLKTEPTPRGHDGLGPVTDALGLVTRIEAMILQGWQDLGSPAPIAAISSAGVGEDGLYVDAALDPLSAAVPWFDTRATAEAAELAGNPAASPRAGIVMDRTRTAPKWLWFARHQPEVPRSARCWLSLTDYPLAKWAVTPFISDTLASRTGCYDANTRAWIGPLLTASCAPDLPPVVAAGTVIGTVQTSALRHSGAVADHTLLVAGGHDHPIAAHAIHRIAAQARVDSMGTANVIYGDAPAFVPDRFDPMIAFMASVNGPGKLACLGVFEFTAAVNRLPGGMEAMRHLLALPKIPGHPGLTAGGAGSDPRRVLEWAAMNARLMLDRLTAYGVPNGPIFATGGWSRSRTLLELRASIFGEPVHAPQEKELSVLGAALFATAAVGGSKSFETTVAVVEPREQWRSHYAGLFARFAADRSSQGET